MSSSEVHINHTSDLRQLIGSALWIKTVGCHITTVKIGGSRVGLLDDLDRWWPPNHLVCDWACSLQPAARSLAIHPTSGEITLSHRYFSLLYPQRLTTNLSYNPISWLQHQVAARFESVG